MGEHRLRLLRVAAMVTAVVATSSPGIVDAAGPLGPEPGDASLFDTWTGYESGRFLEGVAAGDFNGDGAPDVAWARQDFFQNKMMVQLNLGDGTLGPSTGYTATSQSNDIAAGDLDGDADLDLVVVSQGDSLNTTIDLYFNNGSGAFARQTITGGTGPKKIALADLSGDGRPDIAVANYWGTADDISVLINNGNGTFAPQSRYPIGDLPAGIAVADLDGDGDRDLAVTRQQSGQIKVHLITNNGSGTFVQAKVLSISSFAGDPVVVSANWDGDGDQDMAVSGTGTETIFILRNSGNLNFTQSPTPGGFSAFDMRPADIDADGDADLLSTSYNSNAGEFVLLENNGNATFAPALSIESGRNPHDLDVADFNLDGRLDIAVANRVTNTGAIHPQRPDGTFAASVSAPPIYPTPFAPFSIVEADFDLDDDIDVAATLPDFFGSGDSVQVMMNNGQGVLTQGDNIASDYDFPRGLAVADFNDDLYPDLVWAPDDPPYPYVYAINNGNGTFGAPVVRFIDTCGTGDTSTADVDNDGDLDIMVANNRSGPGAFCEAVDGTVRIALNQGDGTFADDYGVEVILIQQYALGADLNGDGLTDIMAATPQNAVVLGTGGGLFGPPTSYNARGTDLVAADLDGDTDLDVVSGDSSFSQTTVMRNAGNGTFPQLTVYPSEQVSGYSNVWDLDLGDLDGDGALDVVVSNVSANDHGVHFGHGDGTFETQQIRYGTHANPLDVVVADFNGDGRPDIASGAAIGSSFVSPRGITVLLNQGGGLACTITGTNGPDVLNGTGGADVICGMGGNDTITGRGGDDVLLGGDGKDVLRGSAGSDDLFGEAGNDTLNGRDQVGGNDELDGGTGTDQCRADPGDAQVNCP